MKNTVSVNGDLTIVDNYFGYDSKKNLTDSDRNKLYHMVYSVSMYPFTQVFIGVLPGGAIICRFCGTHTRRHKTKGKDAREFLHNHFIQHMKQIKNSIIDIDNVNIGEFDAKNSFITDFAELLNFVQMSDKHTKGFIGNLEIGTAIAIGIEQEDFMDLLYLNYLQINCPVCKKNYASPISFELIIVHMIKCLSEKAILLEKEFNLIFATRK